MRDFLTPATHREGQSHGTQAANLIRHHIIAPQLIIIDFIRCGFSNLKSISCSQPVRLGTSVAILDHEGDLDFICLVEHVEPGEDASDIAFVSRWSPLGSALMGKFAGDIATFESPGGTRTVEILATDVRHFDAVRTAIASELDGEYSSAAKAFVAIVNYASAARRYLKLESQDEAAYAFERAEYWEDAAPLYENIGNSKQSGRCWELAGKWGSAARCYAAAQCSAEAGKAYEQVGEYRLAVEQYAECSNHAARGRCLEKLCDYKAAAAAYEQAGYYAGGAKCLDHLGDTGSASEMLKKAEALADSARCFELSGEWSAAADNYRRGGKPLEAARCYEKADNLEPAMECYAEANCLDDALRCRALMQMYLGEFDVAAEMFAEAAEYAWWDAARAELLALAEECRRQGEVTMRSHPQDAA
jgi:tetratricopeptide (TPR) repeat protein